jgi:hypothetical protein
MATTKSLLRLGGSADFRNLSAIVAFLAALGWLWLSARAALETMLGWA